MADAITAVTPQVEAAPVAPVAPAAVSTPVTPVAPATPATPAAEKTISVTQTDLNRMMADNRKKLTTENESLASTLEGLQERVRMSDEERGGLSDTIETLRKQTLTQDELTKRELAKKQTEFQTTAKRLETERDSWKDRYTGATIGRSLVDAAVQHGAYDPEQITGILGSKTRLAEKVDEDGKVTGQHEVIVDFDTVDAEGKPVTLALSPIETVKAMKEAEKFANLFVAKGSKGLGLTASEQGGSDGPPEDMAAYMEWRKRHP